jgi:predicted TIM-barrel fold metal-dependent hydrolase
LWFLIFSELRWIVVAAAAGKPLVNAGIVSHADLSLGGAVGPVLDAHMKSPNFRGIRDSCSTTDDPLVASHGAPPRKLYDTKFREGMVELGKRGLTYESWSFHMQLQDLADLAVAFPEQAIVCNHISMPLGVATFAADYGWDGKTAEEWRAGMTELAKNTNVVCKLGGQGMTCVGHNFNLRAIPPSSTEVAAVIGPYLNCAIDAFGCDRCMFESNVSHNCFSTFAQAP